MDNMRACAKNRTQDLPGQKPQRQLGVGDLIISPRAKELVNEVLESNRLSYGPMHERLELMFADIFGPTISLDKKFIVHKVNAGKVSNNDNERMLRSIEFRHIFGLRTFFSKELREKLKKNERINRCWNTIASLKLDRRSKTKLVVPEVIAKKLRDSYEAILSPGNLE